MEHRNLFFRNGIYGNISCMACDMAGRSRPMIAADSWAVFLWRESVGELTQAEVVIHKFMLSWLAQPQCTSKCPRPNWFPARALAKLNCRPANEEVLLWTAEGKTTNDIGKPFSLYPIAR